MSRTYYSPPFGGGVGGGASWVRLFFFFLLSLLILNFSIKGYWKIKGSSEIWSDKLKVLYNRHTESRRGRRLCNVTEVPTAQRATEV